MNQSSTILGLDRRLALGLLGWLVACFLAASLGAVFMPGEWYAALKKPVWNPPAWIFGPVWTALYIDLWPWRFGWCGNAAASLRTAGRWRCSLYSLF